ncbi:MAG: hypothetical protein KAI38_01900 [Candidatus Latescibacteria bacterium]|nr:hypothetical protein [Candidatus Latescibacterota bacterium]MCK5329664.1 hypothetical protein [Candidatus Latescibacterota bacterium]MCK5732909.1 hypothetical protein [Candidatus Latescibacterota bacterium]
MTELTIQLMETDYQRLTRVAKRAGKSVQTFVYERIIQLPEIKSSFDVTQDPVFQMEGYESDAPSDLSAHLDKYLYEGERPT